MQQRPIKLVLDIQISPEINTFIATGCFPAEFISEYDKYPVSSDCGDGIWYPQDSEFLKMGRQLNFFVYKNDKHIIEEICNI